ncbi:MAG: phenylacetate--CoA ligase family protein [Proteobacteria bacterium]|nr:phenylacetate--CoA ligase family protein [Burkholderiales bacterium]
MRESAAGTAPPGLPIRSTVEGVTWPVFPEPAGEAMLAMIWQLERSERLPANRLHALQLVQARAVVRHAATHVPFYRELWRGLDFDPCVDPLTPKRFAALPIVTRAMLAQAGVAAVSAVVPAGHGAIQIGATSDANGSTLPFRSTGLTQFMWRALTLRDHLWHRRDLGGKLAAIRRMPQARIEESNWGLATASLCTTGPAVGLDIDHDIVDQAAWLIEQNPDSLITYPDNPYALAGWFNGHGVRLPRLHDVRTISAPVTPEHRAACRAAFGVSLVDSYSTKRLGYIALQCPAHDHYHVQEESVVLELVDADGVPVVKGTRGRVIATSLLNFAMPLVRYDTGDHATAGGACNCGRTLRVLGRINGRERNTMQLPGHQRRQPS